MLARRDEMPVEERAQKSVAICRQLEQLVEETCGVRRGCGKAEALADGSADGEVEAAAGCGADGGRGLRVAVYAAMRSEVSLDGFIEAAWARGWDVCFPCMVRDAPDKPSRMALFQVLSEQLVPARAVFLDHPLRCLSCDDLAREGYEAARPRDLDAVVVPLVAFDAEGRRLGYGGGNYDRLLPLLRRDALVVGVAFEEQCVDAVPTEPHDQALPYIVYA